MSEKRTVIVDFFADLSCPWCYVGWEGLKRATIAKSDAVSVTVSWRTFLLSPDAPPEGYDRQQYLSARYDPARLAEAHDALKAAADAAGAPIKVDAARLPNTINAHRVVHWAAGYGLAEPVIDALFRAYFVDGKDISEADVLIAAAEASGMDPGETRERLASDQDRKLMLDLHGAASRLGISGVPVAVFNRRLPVMGAQGPDAYARALEQAPAI